MSSKQNQNGIFFTGFALIALVMVWFLLKPAVLKYFEKNGGEEEINAEIMKATLIVPQDLFEKVKAKNKMIVLDFRSPEEFELGHIAASLNLPAAETNAEKLKSVGAEKNSDIILVNSGDNVLETARKTNELKGAGFVNAKYLQGGMAVWLAEGYPLISGGRSALDESKIKPIDMDTLADDLSLGVDAIQFVDVRGESEFKRGHVPGAVNVPLASVEKDNGAISSVKKVVVYGNGEEDSSKAAVIFFDLNFFNIYTLSGGWDAWQAAGGVVENN